MQQIADKISRCLQAIRPKISGRNYAKLSAIKVPKVHQFVAESAEFCNPERIFVSDDSLKDIAYIRRMAIETGEEKHLATSAHTVHLDGSIDQGRDCEVTKYLVPKGDYLKAREKFWEWIIRLCSARSFRGRTAFVKLTCFALQGV